MIQDECLQHHPQQISLRISVLYCVLWTVYCVLSPASVTKCCPPRLTVSACLRATLTRAPPSSRINDYLATLTNDRPQRHLWSHVSTQPQYFCHTPGSFSLVLSENFGWIIFKIFQFFFFVFSSRECNFSPNLGKSFYLSINAEILSRLFRDQNQFWTKWNNYRVI